METTLKILGGTEYPSGEGNYNDFPTASEGFVQF
jgi:hypothetical protein